MNIFQNIYVQIQRKISIETFGLYSNFDSPYRIFLILIANQKISMQKKDKKSPIEISVDWKYYQIRNNQN